MERVLRWYDYITINIYWFALTTRSQVLAPLVIPLLVQQFVGEEAKGTYVGTIRLWALMVAVLVQALFGLISDRTTHRWGRRRPYIAAGTIAELVIFAAIGFSAGMEGMGGYWTLFVLYILSMISSNAAHAATQGLIPDLVPDEKRGAFSGVKALLELPVPLVFVSFVIGRLVSAGNLWGALIATGAVLLGCMLIAMFVREERLEKAPFSIEWGPFLRLLLMTGIFTAIILSIGAIVKWVMIQALDLPNWLGLLITGVVGVIGMGIAIGLGVWASIRASIGQEARDHPSFTWWVITRLAFLAPSTNLATFVLFFLQERFTDLNGEEAAGPAAEIIMFVGIFVLLTALPSGWLSDRFGKKPLIGIAGISAAVGTAILVLIPDLTAIKVGGCLIGAAVGLFYSASWALGTELVPKEQAGRYLGLSNLAGAGAGAVGAYIGGPIADNMGYVLLFAIFGVLFLMSAVTLRGIEEKRPAKATPAA